MRIQHKHKIILFMSTFVSLSACDPCTPEFLHNLKDVVQLKYNDRSGVINKLIIKMVDNQPFIEMFTETCRQVSNLRLDFREVGSGDWRKYTGRRGTIKLNRKDLSIKNIDPCAKYEVKIVAIVENGMESDSEILTFGPFYKELDEDVVKENLVGVDAMPDISESISYSNVNNSGFTVSWGTICAQSLNFYLLPGPVFAFDDIPFKTMTNVLENYSDNSLWVSTEPCHQYKIAIESFMTKEPIPEEDNYGNSRDHLAIHDVITDPITDTLITISMEEGSYLLIWQLTQMTDCVSIITYEIILIPETGGAAHPLRQGDWTDQSTELDLTEAIYTACSNYRLQMKISYTTSAGNLGERTVFNKYLRTNQLGQFAPEGTNDLTILKDSVAVTFGTCAKEVLVILVDTNDHPIVDFKVIPDYPNTEIEAFTEYTMPCASYNIALRGLDGQVFDERPFLVKRPQGHVSFEQIGFTTSTLEFAVEDIEENRECEANKYLVKCQPQEESSGGEIIGGESEFVGESINGSFIEVRNLAPITSYNCEATIQYTGFEDNADVNSTEGVGFVTEGFDSLEISNGNIILTCESEVEELQLALVHSDGTRITTIDANCTNEQSIDIFARFKQPCVEYSLELFEKKNLDVHDLSSSSNLEVFDSANLPVKPPESHLEMDFLRSDEDSLEFNIENSIENQFCDIETYSITCNMVNSMEVNGGNEGKIEESEIAAIRLEGLIRGEAYSCSAHVTYIPPENITEKWLGASKPMEVNTEGFDSFYLTEDNSIVVKCDSNIKYLKLVLVEVDGANVTAKDAICDEVDSIDNFIEHTKPCGEYKLELISRQEYDDLQDQGQWEGREQMVLQEELLDVKMPEGKPEIRLINTDIDNAEFEVVDERNALCEIEITELWCLGEGADAQYKTSNNSLSIKVVDLTPDTIYSCFATITYTPLNNETDTLDQYENLLNETFGLRSNTIPIQTLPLPTKPPTLPLPTEPPFIPASTKRPVQSHPILVHPYPTPHTRSAPPSDNSPIIIGAIVGIVIVLVAIIIAVVLKRKRSVNNNNLMEKNSATVKVDLAESTVMKEENTVKENTISNSEKEDDVIIKNGATKDVHVDMKIEDVLKGKESVASGLKESSL